MRLRRTVINHSSKLGRALGLLLVSTVLIVSFVASSPSLSKYVLDQIDTEFSFFSAATGTPLTSITSILGTTRQYETLTAGTVSPENATFTYQWQRANSIDGTFIDIPDANTSTFYLDIENNNHYLRLAVTGTGDYTGTVYSVTVGPVVVAAVELESMGAIQGSAIVGQTLTVGTLVPSGATATYQWKIADTINGTYANISGATNDNLLLTESMIDKFVRVYATGSNNYSGTVYAGIGPIVSNKISITDISSIIGTTTIGTTLTAGSLTPSGATVTYQWQRSDASGSIFSDITSATSATYVPANPDDLGLYLRVVATGTGDYSGTVTSVRSGPVVSDSTPLSTFSDIAGTAQVGQTLLAGTLAPSGATANYQWSIADSGSGPWSTISGATSNSYNIPALYYGKYLKVTATGSGSYSGTLDSNIVGPVTAMPLQSIGNISGSSVEGQAVIAGTVLPTGATVTYQWRRYTTTDPAGSYTIIGSDSSTYTLTSLDVSSYIRVAATGTDAYSGTVLSQYIYPVSSGTNLIYVTSIADSIGLTQVFQTLTAGTVSPYGATVTYQWSRSSTMDGTYSNIPGATAKTYALTGADKGYFFKVTATGSGSYAGSAISRYAGPITAAPLISLGNISGTATTGQVLTAGSITPSGATVTYQWLRSDTNGENYTAISGATSNTYGVVAADEGKYIKVQVTGTNLYMGTVVSNFSGPVLITPTPITALEPIVGIPQVAQTLQTGATTPLGATVTYQWSRASTAEGTYTSISGATLATYVPTFEDLNQYLKVTVWGAGIYSTPVEGITSTAFGPITSRPLVSISNIIGKAEVGQIFTAGTVSPVGASVNYQWQWAPANIANPTWSNISGATSNTYTIAQADNGRLIRVQVTGINGYTGTVQSNSNGPIGSPHAIQLITDPTGVTQVGQTLTSGTVLPFGATVTYQWLRSDTIDGTYEAISGATLSTYELVATDQNKYVKVIATGYGLYFGEVISNPTDLIDKGIVVSIGPILGQAVKNQTVSAGAINPVGATVTYQWQRSDTSGANFANISGATLSSYQLAAVDVDKKVQLVVTGSGAYEGTAISPASSFVQTNSNSLIEITALGATTGTATVGQTFTAGAVSPSSSVYTTQWQRSSDNTNFVDIPGATANTYTLTAADFNQYIRAKAVGYDTHTGTVFSVSRQVTGRQALISLGSIQGTASREEVIRAGAILPEGATVSYQWKYYTGFKDPDTSTYSSIAGATDYYYNIPATGTPGLGDYLKLEVVGTGAYTGTLTSVYFGPLTENPSRITSISPIVGSPRVNNILTAGTITPFGASVTYQWFRKSVGAETYSEIPGAISSTYRLTATDYNTNIKVVVTGTAGYYGWAESEPTSLIQTGVLASISDVAGSTVIGQTLTAGSVLPVGASVNWQWMRSVDGGGFEAILGATNSSYTITNEDDGKYLKVQATGVGAYSGVVISNQTGPVVNTPATAITGTLTIGGTVRVNSTLTTSGLGPTGFTVTYQWLRSDISAGTYVPIEGATSSTYLLTPDDYQKYIKVRAVGSGAFSGTKTSAATVQVAACPITGIGAYYPATQQHVDQSVVAGVPVPSNATVQYIWEISSNSKWFTLGTTTSSALIPYYSQQNNGAGGNVGEYIRVTIVGTGAFSGTVVGGTGVLILAPTTQTSLLSIGPVIGTSAVGETLTAGSISPSGATVSYQWQRSTSSTGTFENISGATSSTYVIQSADLGYYFRVVATGTGSYSGVLVSAVTGPVISSGATIPITSISDILYTTVPDLTLTAGTVYPFGATVTYQWLRSDTTDPSGNYSPVSGATSNVYTIPINQTLGYYYKVQVIGSGSYSGTVTSNYTGPVVSTPTALISVHMSGINKVGETLSATSLDPASATVTYQWQVFTGPGGVFADIPGATGATYTLQPAQYNYFVRVIATGSGAYTGSVYADTTTKIIGLLSSAQVTMASPVLGATPQTATQVQNNTNHPDYEVTGLVWNEALTPLGKFKAGTTYTATVTLTSKNTKTFVPTPFTPMIASAASVGTTTTNGSDVGNTVTFTVTFAPTDALLPTSVSVTTQPTKLVYVETTDGVLALDGMVVTETNNDGTTTTSIFTDGTATGYTAAPADGSTLTGAQHNTPVTVTHTASGKTATTNNLTVEAPPSATNVTISGTAAVGSTLTGSYSYGDVNSDLEGTSTYRWLADGTAISGATSNTFVLTASEAGANIQFEVTPVALTGTLTGLPVLSSATQDVASASLGAATVTMTAPVLGATPQAAAGVEAATLNDYFTVTSLTWNEALTAGGKFKADTVYTATITLTSKNDTTFQETAFTPTVTTASSVGSTTTSDLGIGNTVTFTVSFPQTGALVVTDLTILTPPSDMSYVEMTNDTLSLDGLVLTATHNDGSTTQVTFTDGAAVGYTTSPAHGTTLTNALHDGQPITITHTASNETVTTGNLVVQAQAAPTATAVSISGTAQVGQTLTGSYTYADTNGDLEGTSTYQWLAAGSEITGATSTTYVVQAADVGKVITFKVTPAAATGLSPGLTVESSPTTSVIP